MRGPGKINFLARRDNLHPIEQFKTDWAPDLHEDMRIFTYEDMPRPSRLPTGLWVFADVDRLSVNHAKATEAWEFLNSTHGPHVRLLNRPGVSLDRKRLLDRLEATGANRFAVHSMRDWPRITRFPVFVRYSTEHSGALTPLLKDAEALAKCAAEMERRNAVFEDLLIVEFLDTSQDGVFRKYSAFRVGNTILAHHIFHSRDWHVKAASIEGSAERIVEEQDFQRDNPHLEQLREIYGIAKIDFGRIDYAMLDDRVQVWEINTNPLILARRATYKSEQMAAKITFAAAITKELRALARMTCS
jgi:hypothetical protein